MFKIGPKVKNSLLGSKRVMMMGMGMGTIIITILIFGTFGTILHPFTYGQTSPQPSAPNVCPAKNVQHWDKIIFSIKSPELSQRLKIPANTELDIKVLDDPTKIADLKQKVFNFLRVPNETRSAIDIIDVRYAIICVSGQ